jgi:hypothetical protein
VSYVFFDIETLPTTPTDPAWLDHVERLDHGRPDFDAEAERRKTSLDPRFGRVLCIGYAVDAGPIRVVHGLTGQPPEHVERARAFFESGEFDRIDLDDWESVTLRAFALAVADVVSPVFVAHGAYEFDVPFLQTRALYQAWQPREMSLLDLVRALSPLEQKPWERPVHDTMAMFPRRRTSLRDCARLLGVPAQTGPDGSEMYDCWRRGQLREIVEHCRQDVAQVRGVFRWLWQLLAK